MRYIFRVLLLTFLPQVFVFSLLLLGTSDFNNIGTKDLSIIVTLVIGLPALIISITTLVFAYYIRKSEMESKEKIYQDSKNAFEYSLREFFVRVLWCTKTDPQVIEQRDYMSYVVVDLQPHFNNLKITFNNHNLTDYATSSLLTQIEIKFDTLKEIKNMQFRNYVRHLEYIEDILHAIAKKYDFNSLQV